MVGKDKECLYEYKGKVYKTYELVALSTVDGLTVGNITNRINVQGWSVEDAITKPKKQRNQQFEYCGKMYSAMTERTDGFCPNCEPLAIPKITPEPLVIPKITPLGDIKTTVPDLPNKDKLVKIH